MSKSMEIKPVSENEMCIGENKIFFLSELNIIHIIGIGEQTTEMAVLHKELNSKLFALNNGKKISILIDLNKSGKNSPEARQIWIQISESEKTNKVALWGLHPVARVIANFVMGVSKRNNHRFFKTYEEAMAWLQEV